MQSSAKQPTADSSAGTSVLSVLSLLESLVLAITLALIIRGFVVEAFVIPTGSMAQSLLGLHSETVCKNCRYQYTTGIPLEQGTNRVAKYVWDMPLICPNCGDRSVRLTRRDSLCRGGDRVLVLKPAYFLSRYKSLAWLAPKRWDVVVFLYPGSGLDNYIKRLAGLPGESIEIIDGDIYIDGKIARKTPKAQERLWIPVFDNDYQRQRDLQGWPFWQETSANVQRFQHGRQLRLKAKGTQSQISFKGPLRNALTYNCLHRSAKALANATNATDLRLSFHVIPRDLGPAGELTAVLSRRNRYFRLRLAISEPGSPHLELQSGYASPEHEGPIQYRAIRDHKGLALRWELPPTTIGKPLHLSLQNVDFRVSVCLDGQEVLATTDGSYHPPLLSEARALAPSQAPRPNVAITAKDCQVDLLHIKLERDVYYTSPPGIYVSHPKDAIEAKLHGSPARAVGAPFRIPPSRHNPKPAYFMLGDNSSDSQDSRLWWGKHHGLDENYVRGTVPRSHMIGQAFFVYWPAAGPIVGRQLPLIPRVGKMRLIR